MINFFCSSCGQRLQTQEAKGGKTVNCPTCTSEISVPSHNHFSAAEAPVPIFHKYSSDSDSSFSCPEKKRRKKSATKKIAGKLGCFILTAISLGVIICAAIIVGSINVYPAAEDEDIRDYKTEEINNGPVVADVGPAILIRDYQTALAANKKYTGKRILLSDGILRSTNMTKRGPLVRIGHYDADSDIDCYFRSEAEAASLKAVHGGDRGISIIGICRGVNQNRKLEFTDCILVKDLTAYRKNK